MASEQDIDLTSLFRKIGRFVFALRNSAIRAINFLLRNTFIILVLVIIGIVLGYFLERTTEPPLRGEIIINPNVESTIYLYDAIDHFNSKIQANDTTFLKNMEMCYNLNKKFAINRIEVKPIVRIEDILEVYRNFDDDQTSFMLENVDPMGSYFENEVFRNNYKYHRITLFMEPRSTRKVIDGLLAYLEENAFLQARIFQQKQSMALRKEANSYSIQQIDSLLMNINKTLGVNQDSGQISIIGNNGIDMNQVLQTKSHLLSENKSIDQDLLQLNSVFHVFNTPYIIPKVSILQNKMLIFPIVLVLLYIIIFGFIKKTSKQ